MELADYLRMFRDRWIAIISSILIFSIGAYAYSAFQEPVYVAKSSGFVTFGPSDDAESARANDDLSKSRAGSYLGLAKDREIASLVIDTLGLSTTPESLVDKIEVEHDPATVIITITAESDTPEGAQELADAWIAALSRRVAGLESGRGDQGSRLEVTESALLPTAPSSPDVERNVVLGSVLGVLIGVGYAISRTVFDRRLRTAKDVARAADLNFVGLLPSVSSQRPLFVAPNPNEHEEAPAESIRRIRTNLFFTDTDDEPRSVVVTSANRSDGRTTVALNLAAALALTGRRVTIVDADLRHPSLAAIRGLEAAAGLTDVLEGRASLGDALQQDPEIAGLSVLTAGSVTDHPSEILEGRAMRSVVSELVARGTVIFDSSPLICSADAALIARLVDGALIIGAYGSTRDFELRTAVDDLLAVRARPLGVVLNRLPSRRPD